MATGMLRALTVRVQRARRKTIEMICFIAGRCIYLEIFVVSELKTPWPFIIHFMDNSIH